MKTKVLLLGLCCYLHYKYLKATRKKITPIRINLQDLALAMESSWEQTLH
ncbi:hypothetical protein [Legionella clemsonensis]|uniref:Uncharacterized protein n=1 Tax=Legionella clemsonensis TaxID=1867846 RepID=A0A222P2G3_9GAMM|nr:hypothetical protein [Legionella clemsonensis]ASQ46036.1 hypothetical protein clem_07415 [Legionella clemsonensis]